MLYCTSNSFATIWEIEKEERYCVVKISTSRKDKDTGEYVNSNWSFVRFIGEANKKVRTMNKKDRITNISLFLDNEPYEKGGSKFYPKTPKMVVYNFDAVENDVPRGKPVVEQMDENVDDGELPF